MRAMRIFLGFATSTALAGAFAAGCGSSSSPATPVDSGTMADVTMEAMPQMEAAPPEAGPDVVDAGPDVCVPDASLTSLQSVDAALNDAGATVGGCFACISMVCPQLVTECDQSCACVSDFQSFSNCLAGGGSLLICAGSLGNLTSLGVDASAIQCGVPCLTQCGQSLPTGDAAPPDSSTGDTGTPDAAGD